VQFLLLPAFDSLLGPNNFSILFSEKKFHTHTNEQEKLVVYVLSLCCSAADGKTKYSEHY
jgi:hypothetical protein